ncbi:MAG: 3-hydroxyacyl-CoA dehydrogenase [Corynebacterium sp.]|nr:3-hydroxyacyl-CoA dehydrogenase [Corynebacterium sp.]
MTGTSPSTLDTVLVAGSGVLGSQIALQCAFQGKKVTIYDVAEEALAKLPQAFERYAKGYKHDLDIDPAKVLEVAKGIGATTDIAEAAKGADIVIEAVPEKLEIKQSFYESLAPHLPENTILCTNTSTLLPSAYAAATGRPEKFCALHFANEVWKHNTGEVMPHAETDPATIEEVTAFANEIGLIALPLKREQPGYILNSLLVPLLDAGVDLMIADVADPEVIDKTWVAATGSNYGPAQILDIVGLQTPYHITSNRAEAGDEAAKKRAEFLKPYIEAGRTGISAGKGIYDYEEDA